MMDSQQSTMCNEWENNPAPIRSFMMVLGCILYVWIGMVGDKSYLGCTPRLSLTLHIERGYVPMYVHTYYDAPAGQLIFCSMTFAWVLVPLLDLQRERFDCVLFGQILRCTLLCTCYVPYVFLIRNGNQHGSLPWIFEDLTSQNTITKRTQLLSENQCYRVAFATEFWRPVSLIDTNLNDNLTPDVRCQGQSNDVVIGSHK